MNVVTKTIYRKLKIARDKERLGDTEKFGKRMHDNAGNAQNVQDVGQNQTFNQLVGGDESGSNANAVERKHQMQIRKEQL